MSTQTLISSTAEQAPISPRSRPRPEVMPTAAVGFTVLVSSAGFGAVIGTGGWAGPPVVMVVSLCLVGAVGLALRAPMWAIPVVQVITGAFVLVGRFVADAPLHMIPTSGALTDLRAVLHTGLADVQAFAPPVPPTDGIVSLVTLGVGVVTMCVFVAVVIVRMPLLGIAGLAGLYAVPAITVSAGAPWWTFACFSAGALLLLTVDTRERIDQWGTSTSPHASRRLSGLLRPALRLGAVGVLVAVLLPPLVPGLTAPFLGGRGPNAGEGTSAEAPGIALDPFVSLRRNLFFGPEQGVFQYQGPLTYFRSVIADVYVSDAFAPTRLTATDSVPLAGSDLTPSWLDPSITRRNVSYRLRATGLSDRLLPLPAPVSGATVGCQLGGDCIDTAGDPWLWDPPNEVAYSRNTDTSSQQWDATALVLEPTPAQLRSFAPQVTEIRERNRIAQLASLPATLVTLAQSVSAGYTTSYDQMLAIQWWLRTSFQYSQDVRGDPTGDQLTAFLRDRVGYCQQFAATMALMARALNLQSRVAVGFTGGRPGANGWASVSNRNAHAWPEVYFGSAGWVRFEPTPQGEVGPIAAPVYASQDELERVDRQNTQQPQSEPTRTPTDPTEADQGNTGSAGPLRWLVLAALTLALGAAVGLPILVRARRRRRRLADPGDPEGAWRELRDDVTDLGGVWLDTETPGQTRTRINEVHPLGPDARDALDRLTHDVESARYSPGGGRTRDRHDDLTALRSALRARLDKAGQLRATLWPRSIFTRNWLLSRSD